MSKEPGILIVAAAVRVTFDNAGTWKMLSGYQGLVTRAVRGGVARHYLAGLSAKPEMKTFCRGKQIKAAQSTK